VAELIPSYLQKISRAEKHLVDLNDEVARFQRSEPYLVRERVKRKNKKKRKVWALEFTKFPENTDVGVIAADLVHNLHSAVDHLAYRLASKERTHVEFPILWQGVWVSPDDGDNEQRLKDRERWATCTRNMRDEAVAHIKTLQPPDIGGHHPEQFNALWVIKRLSNTDKHSKLPVTAPGLVDVSGDYRMPDGLFYNFTAPQTDTGANFVMKDGAEIPNIPQPAMDVNLDGTPAIVVRITEPSRDRERDHIDIPGSLALCIEKVREGVIGPLIPYISSV
jgi:hypothetical protein